MGGGHTHGRQWSLPEFDVLSAIFNHVRRQEGVKHFHVVRLALKVLPLVKDKDLEYLEYSQIDNKLQKSLKARKLRHDQRWRVDMNVESREIQKLVEANLNLLDNDGTLKQLTPNSKKTPVARRDSVIVGSKDGTHRKKAYGNQASTKQEHAARRCEKKLRHFSPPERNTEVAASLHPPDVPGTAAATKDPVTSDNFQVTVPRRQAEQRVCYQTSVPTAAINGAFESPLVDVAVARERTQLRIEHDADMPVETTASSDPDLVIGRLASWELNLIQGLRPIWYHGANAKTVVPAKEEVAEIFDKIEKEVDHGLEAFLRGSQFSDVTYFNIHEDTFNISSVIVSCKPLTDSNSITEAARPLSTLFKAPVANVIKAYITACIYQFVMVEFDDNDPPMNHRATVSGFEIFSQRKYTASATFRDQTNTILVNNQLYTNLHTYAHVEHLKHAVKPTFPHVAVRLSQRVEQILVNIGVARGGFAAEPPATRQDAMLRWQKSMANAFEMALDLRLRFELSPLEYIYQFPRYATPFDPVTMEADGQEANSRCTGTVWACYRPFIQCWNPSEALREKSTVIKAKIVLD